jgi:hypothetical protein
MKNNVGEAILILGCIYFFTIIEGWARWLLLILILAGFWTWSTHFGEKEQKDLLKYSVEKIKVEIQLMKAQTQFYVARGAAIMRNLKKN